MSLGQLLIRLVDYTVRHLRFNPQRVSFPVFSIALGTMLVYLVDSLGGLIQGQLTQFSGLLRGDTATAVVTAVQILAILTLIVASLETTLIMIRVTLVRQSEVGILKATGISTGVIVSLFGLEALAYGVGGGSIGILAGWVFKVGVEWNSSGLVALDPHLGVAVKAWAMAVLSACGAAALPVIQVARLSVLQALQR